MIVSPTEIPQDVWDDVTFVRAHPLPRMTQWSLVSPVVHKHVRTRPVVVDGHCLMVWVWCTHGTVTDWMYLHVRVFPEDGFTAVPDELIRAVARAISGSEACFSGGRSQEVICEVAL